MKEFDTWAKEQNEYMCSKWTVIIWQSVKKMIENMIKETGENLIITGIGTVEDDEGEIYVFCAKDNDTGVMYHPGEKIKSIRKNSGEILELVLEPPTH